jgi:putative transposase
LWQDFFHAKTSSHRCPRSNSPYHLPGTSTQKNLHGDIDRNRFVARLSDVIQKTLTPCFAWSLIPNRFYLLLQTGTSPIATFMEKLLTGYAGEFNRRHNRHGHLFQNRYKSILCQTDRYLLELVRYIHLNPIRAGIVGSTPSSWAQP